MRHYELYEHSSFLVLASSIWEFANDSMNDEKYKLRSKARDDLESWEGYLWRMITTIKYNNVWSGYRDLATSMKNNAVNYDKYHQIQKYLERFK